MSGEITRSGKCNRIRASLKVLSYYKAYMLSHDISIPPQGGRGTATGGPVLEQGRSPATTPVLPGESRKIPGHTLTRIHTIRLMLVDPC